MERMKLKVRFAKSGTWYSVGTDRGSVDFSASAIPTESTMADLLEGTQSTLTIDELAANADVPDKDLVTSALERLP